MSTIEMPESMKAFDEKAFVEQTQREARIEVLFKQFQEELNVDREDWKRDCKRFTEDVYWKKKKIEQLETQSREDKNEIKALKRRLHYWKRKAERKKTGVK
jgi:hypothetical protein